MNKLRKPNQELNLDDESELRKQQLKGIEEALLHAQQVKKKTELIMKESLDRSYHHLQVSLNYLQDLNQTQPCPNQTLHQRLTNHPCSNQCQCCQTYLHRAHVADARRKMIQLAKKLRQLHALLGYQSPYVGVLERAYLSAEGKILHE